MHGMAILDRTYCRMPLTSGNTDFATAKPDTKLAMADIFLKLSATSNIDSFASVNSLLS